MSTEAILFDVGNVLGHDGHETYLTDEVYGLALDLDLPRQELLDKVTPVFRKYAVVPQADETEFWGEVSQTLGIELSAGTIASVKHKLSMINPEAMASFKLLQSRNINIGIISNSTPMFYPEVAELLSLDEYIDPELVFLSHIQGCLKSGGLFEIAAAKVEPSTTLIIDDRPLNVQYAKKLGFQAVVYSLKTGDSLLDLITDCLEIKE